MATMNLQERMLAQAGAIDQAIEAAGSRWDWEAAFEAAPFLKTPKARKEHACKWCALAYGIDGEECRIRVGERYGRYSYPPYMKPPVDPDFVLMDLLCMDCLKRDIVLREVAVERDKRWIDLLPAWVLAEFMDAVEP